MPWVGLLARDVCSWLFSSVALLTALIGMAASMLHLARVWRAPFSLRGLKSSWLSREIGAVLLHAIMLALWCMASWMLFCIAALGDMAFALCGAPLAFDAIDATTIDQSLLDAFITWSTLIYVFEICSLASGALLVFTIYKAYAINGQPAWNGVDTLVEVCGVGFAVAGSLSLLLQAVIGVVDIPVYAFSLFMLCIGLFCFKKSQNDRMQRLRRDSERDNRPRVDHALREAIAAEGEYRKLFNIQVIAVAIAFIFVAFNIVAEAAFGTEGGNIAVWLIGLVLAFAAFVMTLVACCKIRVRFYEFANDGKTAVALHRW